MKTYELWINENKDLTIYYTKDLGRYVVRDLYLYDNGDTTNYDAELCDSYCTKDEMFEALEKRFGGNE